MTAPQNSSEPIDEEIYGWVKARILGACMERAKRLFPAGNFENESAFFGFVNSVMQYADSQKICRDAILELQENYFNSQLEELITASNEQGLWEEVITPFMKVREVMES